MKTFTSVESTLLSSTKLTSSQKLFIAYVIGWQQNNKECFQSNKKLAEVFGLKISGIRSLILSLNKFNFFTSTKLNSIATEDNWTSTHKISIDENLLFVFLLGENKVITTPSTKEQPVEEIKIVEEAATIEEIKIIEKPVITISTVSKIEEPQIEFDYNESRNKQIQDALDELSTKPTVQQKINLVFTSKNPAFGFGVPDKVNNLKKFFVIDELKDDYTNNVFQFPSEPIDKLFNRLCV